MTGVQTCALPISRLHPYPFERWRELTRDITPNASYAPISLGIGEPKHPTPALIEEALVRALPALSSYPPRWVNLRCARPSVAGCKSATAWRWTWPPKCCP